MKLGGPVNEQVITANVELYRQIADKYEHYEACATQEYFQRMLEADLDQIQTRLQSKPPRCLDCGGGAGNLTLKMLKRGWTVTVVDVSPDMLEISKAKCNAGGYTAEFVNDSIEHFLSLSNDTFDVISFSSVLHHLYSPVEVVKEVASRIRPSGFFYSNFDPVPPASRFLATCFSNVDTILAKLWYDRKDLLPGIKRRLQKLTMPQDAAHARAVASPGDLAEYHARTGLDEASIAQALEQMGFSVDLVRYPVGRSGLVRWVNNRLRVVLSYRIMAQRTRSS